MNDTGIEVPFTITGINGEEVLDYTQFANLTSDLTPGDTITLTTDKGDYEVTTAENPDNASKAFIGIGGLELEVEVKEEYSFLEPFSSTFGWISLLLVWLFLINIGIGLFNLLPLGPVDGGRMFYSACLFITKKESLAKTLLIIVSLFVLALIIINMIPWLDKLFSWIWSSISLLATLLI